MQHLSLSRASPSQHLSLRLLVSCMLISHVCYARLLAGAPDEADDLWATCTHPWCHAWRHVFHGGCSASPSGMLLDVLAADCQQLHTCLHRLVGMRSKYCTRRGLADVWAYRIRARAQYLVVRARDESSCRCSTPFSNGLRCAQGNLWQPFFVTG